MEKQPDYRQGEAGPARAMHRLHKYLEESGLERLLLEVLRPREPQIEGCAYGLEMTTEGRHTLGESEGRIYALSA